MSAEQDGIEDLFQQLICSQLCHFPTSGRRIAVPSKHGIYIIYDASGNVLHVGKSSRGKNGIRQRLQDHLAGRSSFVELFFERDRAQLRDGCAYRYLEVENPRLRALLEAYAIGNLCPKHIGLNERTRNSS